MSWLHSSSRDRQGYWLLVLISDSWQLFAATKKGSITKSVPPCQWREPGGDAEQLPVMTYIMALHPISVETGTGRKANGAGSWLWGGVGGTELLLGPFYPPGTCWLISMLLILPFLPAGVVERVWDWRFGDTEFTFKVWGLILSASSLGYKVLLFSGSKLWLCHLFPIALVLPFWLVYF